MQSARTVLGGDERRLDDKDAGPFNGRTCRCEGFRINPLWASVLRRCATGQHRGSLDRRLSDLQHAVPNLEATSPDEVPARRVPQHLAHNDGLTNGTGHFRMAADQCAANVRQRFP